MIARGIEGYVLVTFKDEEDITAVIPGRNVECNNTELKEGDEVNITWSDGRKYLGTVVIFGRYIIGNHITVF